MKNWSKEKPNQFFCNASYHGINFWYNRTTEEWVSKSMITDIMISIMTWWDINIANVEGFKIWTEIDDINKKH